MRTDLTGENILGTLLRFSVPYLLSCFLQTFYGLADLFIAGRFYGAEVITAVSVGSQVMHMFTIVLAGLAMGTSVYIGKGVGMKDGKTVARGASSSAAMFAAIALGLTVLLLIFRRNIVSVLNVPQESVPETLKYLTVCVAGMPFITAYNAISSVYRGLGDSRTPMYFVMVSGLVNIACDYVMMGHFDLGASGAAAATVFAQVLSVAIALAVIGKNKMLRADSGRFAAPYASCMADMLKVGLPIACQDGLIQASFIVITAIANTRGVEIAAAVGIVEKIISFLFLVLSAMLASVSAISAQNIGAGNETGAHRVLKYGITVCLIYGGIVCLICQFASGTLVSWFANGDGAVIRFGRQYLTSYSIDCIAAGVHFCFSGFFAACGKAGYSFIQDIASIVTLRVPGAYFAAVLFPLTLYPMGLCAPLGSLFSDIICILLFRRLIRQKNGA